VERFGHENQLSRRWWWTGDRRRGPGGAFQSLQARPRGLQAERAAKFCLQFAGLKPLDVPQPWAYPLCSDQQIFWSGPRWHYALRHCCMRRISEAARLGFGSNAPARFALTSGGVAASQNVLGIDPRNIKFSKSG